MQIAHRLLRRAIRDHRRLLKLITRTERKVDSALEQERFLEDPFKYSKRLLDPSPSRGPSFTKATADTYFKACYSDDTRSNPFAPFPGLPRPADPGVAFNTDPPTREQSHFCSAAPGFFFRE